MIQLKNVNKTFKVAKRNAGLKNAAKALFKKEYSYIHALRDINFTIGDGEMVAYIGPNGAGKSSTVKVMSGILTPDSGECIINNRTPWKERVNHVKEIGVVFGQRSQLWWDVPVVDSFELIKGIYKIEDSAYNKRFDELVEMLNLNEIVKTPTRQLSLGQRIRCEIAASLLHNPKTLFLDEPTIGLDAVSKIAVREFIKRLNKENNTTVILTTHDMQDIEALTERVILIGKGRILIDGKLEELKKRSSTFKTLTIDYIGENLPKLENIKVEEDLSGHAKIILDTSLVSVSNTITEIAKFVDILDFTVVGESIEETVASLYKEFEI